jgi:glycosyltransferase involved in cell wall biosynthesis
MAQAVEVTVVIPTRNRWELLSRRALRSALAQEGVALEVIVVDDGSVDETPQRLREVTDERVRLIRHEPSRGVSLARNAGIDAARGEWVAFLDDDDSWAPDKLRTQLEAVRAAGADICYSGVVSIDGDGNVLYDYPVPDPDRLRHDILASCVIPAGPSNVVVRTDLVRQVGGFDERLSHLADWDCWIRLAWAGTASSSPELHVAYLEHLEGMSLSLPREAFAELAYLDRKHRALRDEHGIDIDRVAFAHYVAWLQLRRQQHARAARVYLRSAIANRRPKDAIPAARFAVRSVLPLRRRRDERSAVPAPPWLGLYG